MRQNAPPLTSGADTTCKRPRPRGASPCKVRVQVQGIPRESDSKTGASVGFHRVTPGRASTLTGPPDALGYS